MIIPEKILNNGVHIPAIGLGTYPMKGKQLINAVKSATENGYRMIDSADNYDNEADLGDALQNVYTNSGIRREELFLVSKVSDALYPAGSYGAGTNRGIYFWKQSPLMRSANALHDIVWSKLENTLKCLHTDYLDLYLIHWPYPDFFTDIWREFEEIYKAGLVRAIGVCNCNIRHLKTLAQTSDCIPMVNQIETSPLNTKTEIIDYCNANRIQVMVYSPLMSLKRREEKAYQEYLGMLADRYNCGTGQIVLRFDIQRGLIPIPKSSDASRQKENLRCCDFELTKSEMTQLADFNINLQYLPESRSCPGL